MFGLPKSVIVIPAKAGIQRLSFNDAGVPAFAGTTRVLRALSSMIVNK